MTEIILEKEINVKEQIEEVTKEPSKYKVIFMNDNELKYEDGVFYDKRDDYNSIPVYPSLDADNVSSSWMYILTGLHLAHLIGGIISLIVVTIKSLLKKYTANDIVGIEVSSIYWHFLDFLWGKQLFKKSFKISFILLRRRTLLPVVVGFVSALNILISQQKRTSSTTRTV